MRDSDIIDLYWKRDEQAIEESQKVYGKYCLSIAFRILRDREDSDECVNDTWLKAWNAIPPAKPERLAVCLGTITRNLAIDKWKVNTAGKRGGGETGLVLDELAECIPDRQNTEQMVEAKELERMINAFLHTLSEKDCNVFLRRYYYAEECSEIAKRYGMKVNSVKTTLFRTRGRLKQYLEQQGYIL